MKRNGTIITLLAIILVANIVSLGAFLYQATHKPEPTPYHVTDKNEFGGRCYVQTWVEVTPEDYIGLDVGDEFKLE